VIKKEIHRPAVQSVTLMKYPGPLCRLAMQLLTLTAFVTLIHTSQGQTTLHITFPAEFQRVYDLYYSVRISEKGAGLAQAV
jgi:hypothetical protein